MKDETVTIPVSELKAIQEGMNAMKSEIAILKKGEGPKIMKAPKEHLVTVSFLNGRAVIGYVNKGTTDRPLYVYEAPNPQKPTEYVLYVDVILKGDEKNPVKVLYMEFMEHAERHECPILSIRKEEWTDEKAGSTRKKQVPDGAYYVEESDIIVPLEARGEIRFFKVRLPDNSEVELHERYANISK